jgi:D-threonine aldolase
MKDNRSDNIRSAYSSAIGKQRRELVTPALILDLDTARRNISTMAEKLTHLHAKLRPHVKVQKCTELALMQVEAGAIGVCTATVWEAITMSRAGINDVLIANGVVGKEKTKALASAAKAGYLTVAVDDKSNVDELAGAVQAAGSALDVLIEIDVGMGRGGVRSIEGAVELARHIASANSFLSRAFSCSNSFSRLASDTSKPPYLSRQR